MTTQEQTTTVNTSDSGVLTNLSQVVFENFSDTTNPTIGAVAKAIRAIASNGKDYKLRAPTELVNALRKIFSDFANDVNAVEYKNDNHYSVLNSPKLFEKIKKSVETKDYHTFSNDTDLINCLSEIETDHSEQPVATVKADAPAYPLFDLDKYRKAIVYNCSTFLQMVTDRFPVVQEQLNDYEAAVADYDEDEDYDDSDGNVNPNEIDLSDAIREAMSDVCDVLAESTLLKISRAAEAAYRIIRAMECDVSETHIDRKEIVIGQIDMTLEDIETMVWYINDYNQTCIAQCLQVDRDAVPEEQVMKDHDPDRRACVRFDGDTYTDFRRSIVRPFTMDEALPSVSMTLSQSPAKWLDKAVFKDYSACSILCLDKNGLNLNVDANALFISSETQVFSPIEATAYSSSSFQNRAAQSMVKALHFLAQPRKVMTYITGLYSWLTGHQFTWCPYNRPVITFDQLAIDASNKSFNALKEKYTNPQAFYFMSRKDHNLHDINHHEFTLPTMEPLGVAFEKLGDRKYNLDKPTIRYAFIVSPKEQSDAINIEDKLVLQKGFSAVNWELKQDLSSKEITLNIPEEPSLNPKHFPAEWFAIMHPAANNAMKDYIEGKAITADQLYQYMAPPQQHTLSLFSKLAAYAHLYTSEVNNAEPQSLQSSTLTGMLHSPDYFVTAIYSGVASLSSPSLSYDSSENCANELDVWPYMDLKTVTDAMSYNQLPEVTTPEVWTSFIKRLTTRPQIQLACAPRASTSDKRLRYVVIETNLNYNSHILDLKKDITLYLLRRFVESIAYHMLYGKPITSERMYHHALRENVGSGCLVDVSPYVKVLADIMCEYTASQSEGTDVAQSDINFVKQMVFDYVNLTNTWHFPSPPMCKVGLAHDTDNRMYFIIAIDPEAIVAASTYYRSTTLELPVAVPKSNAKAIADSVSRKSITRGKVEAFQKYADISPSEDVCYVHSESLTDEAKAVSLYFHTAKHLAVENSNVEHSSDEYVNATIFVLKDLGAGYDSGPSFEQEVNTFGTMNVAHTVTKKITDKFIGLKDSLSQN